MAEKQPAMSPSDLPVGTVLPLLAFADSRSLAR
jgi:hypothetical protein